MQKPRPIFLFIQVESLLDKKSTSGPEAFSKPLQHSKIPSIVQSVWQQQNMTRDEWFVIFYTNYSEERRTLIQNWLKDQCIWSYDPHTFLLMRDPTITCGHISWVVSMVHQLSAMLGANEPRRDWCHVFDQTGKALQDAFNQRPGIYADTIVYKNAEELREDIHRVLAGMQ